MSSWWSTLRRISTRARSWSELGQRQAGNCKDMVPDGKGRVRLGVYYSRPRGLIGFRTPLYAPSAAGTGIDDSRVRSLRRGTKVGEVAKRINGVLISNEHRQVSWPMRCSPCRTVAA